MNSQENVVVVCNTDFPEPMGLQFFCRPYGVSHRQSKHLDVSMSILPHLSTYCSLIGGKRPQSEQ